MEPPFSGTAVKVTVIPSQTGLAEGLTTIATGKTGRTDIVTEFDMAGFPVAHESLEVIWQVTTSLLVAVKE